MASNTKTKANPWQSIPSWMRDSLTGEELQPKSLRYALRDYGGTWTRPKAIPNKIHVSKMVTVENLDDASFHIGHQAWTKLFTAYMADIVPAEVDEAERLWYRWYTEPYLVGRVQAHYRPEEAVRAAMALHRDKMKTRSIFQQFRRTLAWVEQHYQRMTAFVRFNYLLEERQRLLAYIDAGTIAARTYN